MADNTIKCVKISEIHPLDDYDKLYNKCLELNENYPFYHYVERGDTVCFILRTIENKESEMYSDVESVSSDVKSDVESVSSDVKSVSSVSSVSSASSSVINEKLKEIRIKILQNKYDGYGEAIS